jgi:hypothetical protein
MVFLNAKYVSYKRKKKREMKEVLEVNYFFIGDENGILIALIFS